MSTAGASPFHQEFDNEFGTASDAPPASPPTAVPADAAGATAVPAASPVPATAPPAVVPAAAPAPVAAPAVPPAAVPAPVVPGVAVPVVFRREIDLGDGSGKQVFEAPTEAALLDKLTEAQTHGTRKIRTQQQQLRRLRRAPAAPVAPVTAPVAPARLTADEEFLLGQSFATNPIQTFERLLEATTGMKSTEFAQTAEEVRQFKAAQAGEAAAKDFVADHQGEFAPTPGNERRVLSFLEREGLAMTRDNLEIAFEELSASGLLEAAAPAATAVLPAVIPPVAPASTVSTGISPQGTVPPVPVSGDPSALNASEVDALPLADARQRILHELHRIRTGQAPAQ